MKGELDSRYITFNLVDNVLHATYKPAVLSLDVVKEVVSLRKEYCSNKSYPHLVMDYSVAKIDKEARDYLSSEQGVEGVLAAAIITNSTFKMALINFFLKVTKPEIPARFFTDQDEALKWLGQFKEI